LQRQASQAGVGIVVEELKTSVFTETSRGFRLPFFKDAARTV